MPTIDAIKAHLAALPGVTVQEMAPWAFYFTGDQTMHPFATVSEADVAGDDASQLDREGYFRVNLGLPPATYARLFPDPDAEWDFTADDVLMPHPVYAPQRFACMVRPGAAGWEVLQPLLAEAHAESRRRHGA